MEITWCLLVCLALPVSGAETFPLPAGDGGEIRSPIDPKTVEVEDQGTKVQLPAGMVYVPAGSFTFGRSEQRHLPAFGIGRFEVTNAEYKAFLASTGHRGTPRYLSRYRLAFGSRCDGATGGVSQHKEHTATEHVGGKLQAGDVLGGCDIADD